MFILDAHLDLSWNALGWNRDLDQTVAEIRLSEAGIEGKARGKNTVAFPEMRQGQIGIVLSTLLSRANRTRAFLARLPYPGDRLRHCPGTTGLLPAVGAARGVRDVARLAVSPKERFALGKRRRRWAARVHPQHGGRGPDPVPWPRRRVVSGWSARGWSVALRPQRLCARHGLRRRP